MDKTKLLAVLALAVAGGAVALSKAPQTATNSASATNTVTNSDAQSDHGDEAHSETASSTNASSTDVAGGVTELKIEDLRKGDGAVAAPGDNLTMNYRGTLLSGKEFDASYGREPFQFQLGGGQVIKGWDEGIKGMKVGGKRKLTIPASLGYGDQGAGADIPPGATLVFEVELLKVEKTPK